MEENVIKWNEESTANIKFTCIHALENKRTHRTGTNEMNNRMINAGRIRALPLVLTLTWQLVFSVAFDRLRKCNQSVNEY